MPDAEQPVQMRTEVKSGQTSEGYLFKISRDRHAPMKLRSDLLLQRLGGARFTVDHEGPLRGLPQATEPAQDFAVVGVGAQVLHSLDAGADGDLGAVHLHELRA